MCVLNLVLQAAVIIDGKALTFALDVRVQESFLKLSLACKSVICCRCVIQLCDNLFLNAFEGRVWLC